MEDPKNPRTWFSADDWSKENIFPYGKSKVLAEKAAWKFVADLPEGEKFELATILPGMILGPMIAESSFNSVGSYMMGQRKKISNSWASLTDVRDCA